ncbi:MAG: type I secretion C-terminal target domain-containing protein [Rhodoferax sp.]|nr:type I secretion C-terminal target domain-containing protein [Rhodoferax sp.]
MPGVNVYVSDGQGGTATAALSLSVSPVADAPLLAISVSGPVADTPLLPGADNDNGLVYAYAAGTEITAATLGNHGASLFDAEGNGFGIQTDGERTNEGAKVIDGGERMVIRIPDAARGDQIKVTYKHVDNEHVTVLVYDAHDVLLNPGAHSVVSSNNGADTVSVSFQGDPAYVVIGSDAIDPLGGRNGFNVLDVDIGYSKYVYSVTSTASLTDSSETLSAVTLAAPGLLPGATLEGHTISSDHVLSAAELNGISGQVSSSEWVHGVMVDQATTYLGSSTAETLVGGDGNDLLIGGQGSDTLTGGAGSDTFQWRLADFSASHAPHDTVTDFALSTVVDAGGVKTITAQGDVLDFKDLLTSDTSTAALVDKLASHLDLGADASGDVVLTAHAVGSATPTQTITLSGVHMASLDPHFSGTQSELSDVAALQKLLDGHNIKAA